MTASVRMTEAVDGEWSGVDSVSVGQGPLAHETPSLFVTVADDDKRILRIDVYSNGAECRAFQDAILWRDSVIVGFGGHVHAIALADHTVVTIETSPYFGGLYATNDYLLIASGERLLRMEPDRSVLWTSEILGIDGVVVRDPGPGVVLGDGEWDPPGGWRPFALSAENGKPVQ